MPGSGSSSARESAPSDYWPRAKTEAARAHHARGRPCALSSGLRSDERREERGMRRVLRLFSPLLPPPPARGDSTPRLRRQILSCSSAVPPPRGPEIIRLAVSSAKAPAASRAGRGDWDPVALLPPRPTSPKTSPHRLKHAEPAGHESPVRTATARSSYRGRPDVACRLRV